MLKTMCKASGRQTEAMEAMASKAVNYAASACQHMHQAA